MKNILIAIRSIFKKGRHNVMKIVSLGIGLAVGLVLIAKVYFEQSYDDFYPDRDRVYQVWAKYQQKGGELKDYPQTSGGIAPTMQQQIPEYISFSSLYAGIITDSIPRSRPSPDTRVLETGPLR